VPKARPQGAQAPDLLKARPMVPFGVLSTNQGRFAVA
jgi:hypothetical protein